jgi:hypothetical protein
MFGGLNVNLPFLLKVVSRLPSGLYLAIAIESPLKSFSELVSVPNARILPSFCITRSFITALSR